MPEDEMLDAMAQKVAGTSFDELTDPNAKARVIELAIMAEASDWLLDIARWFRKSDNWERPL